MLKIFITGVALSMTTALFGADFSCPEEIHTEQKLAAPVSGWNIFQDKVNERHHLHDIYLYDGPPEGLADLVPDNEEASDKEGAVWTFSPSAGHRIWEVCVFNDTSIRLSRELPSTIRKCQIVRSKVLEPGIETLRCQ